MARPKWIHRLRTLLAVLGVLGPGLVSGLADNDAGGITTYTLTGAHFGYALLWVILASQVVLFFTQEVGARLGLATGKGLMGLIRERWGVRWVAFAVFLMLIANLGCTVFTRCSVAEVLVGHMTESARIHAGVLRVARSLLDLDLAQAVQPFGEGGGEAGRHMLDDDDACREIGRQHGKHFHQRLRAAGRAADRHNTIAARHAYGMGGQGASGWFDNGCPGGSGSSNCEFAG